MCPLILLGECDPPEFFHLLTKSEGKRPLVRPRRRWVDNIRTNLQEVGCGYMDWPRIETGGGRL